MFLLIDNYDSFTFNLVQAFMQLGRAPVVVKSDDPALPDMAKRPDLSMVCISPGPGHPSGVPLCAEFLRVLPPEVPVLGVCLGHQILGHFAGARVEVGSEVMHGKQSDISHDCRGIFSGLPSPLTVGRYHSLLVHAEDVPKTLVVTARTASGEVMAMRFADRPWVGIQFHPESVLTPEGLHLLANFPSALLAENGTRFSPGEELSTAARLPRPRSSVSMSVIMETLAQGRDLTEDEAGEAFSRLMDGELPPSQAGALLLGLRAKGETPEEMGEAVRAVIKRAVPVPSITGDVMDIVGTGGDGKSSFNCSTATALILAAMGHKVLKHGNRSVSSRCGSADVLERLRLPLDTPPERVPEQLEREGFVFLFASRYHPSFRHIMPLRRELGVRTLFNLIGPLVNPARPSHHLLGVADSSQLRLVAETLARAPRSTGVVVRGAGGYDELTPQGESELIFVEKGSTHPGRLDPAEYGFTPCREAELAVNGPEDATEAMQRILRGDGPAAMRDMVALNLGMALYVLGMNAAAGESLDPARGYNVPRMAGAMRQAREAVANGAGRRFCHA